jgi:Putative phage tail protein
MPLSLLANQSGKMSGGTIGTFAGALLGVAAVLLAPVTFGTSLAAFSLAISIGAAAGGLLGGAVDYLTAPDAVNEAESIAGMQVQNSAYGQPMAQLFPPWRLAGNIIWMGIKQERRSRNRGGAKGGGPQNVTITKTYNVDLAIALCDCQHTGPMGGIRRAWADGTLIYEEGAGPFPSNWTFYPGTDTQPGDPQIGFAPVTPTTIPAFIYTCYLVMNNYDMGAYPRVPNFTFEVYGPEGNDAGVPLGDVVQKLCVAAGVPAENLDLADVPDLRTRLGLLAIQPVRGILEQLTVAYRFALQESGATLVGRRIGSGAVLDRIPEGDLDASEQAQAAPTGLIITRERTRVLPTQLSISYISPSRSYQQNTQQATIGSIETVETARSLTSSLGLDDTDAKALAQESLDRVWIERTGYAFTVGRRWAWLEPGDRVEVESRGYVHTVMLTDVEYGRPGLVVCKARADSAPVLFVEGAAPATGISTDQILTYLQPTLLRFLDLPALDSNDQAPRIHVAYGYPEETGWPGATLHRAADGGDTYEMVHIGTLEAIGGTALTVLPDAPAHLTDTTSTVQVQLTAGAILPITAAAFQAGGNLAMLGSELIQFREAELIAEATYELRHLWRGRRGTQWATGTHVVGEEFTWLDPAVYRLEQPLDERYVPRQWKAVTRGLPITSATAQTYALQSENLRPWPAASLRWERVGDDWHISWRGTARFSGAWIDGSQASPDPDFLTYRVVIYTDATAATIVRQVDQGASADWQAREVYTYTAAQQTADFGSVQSVLHAQVFQVGRTDVSRPAAA